MKTAYLFSGQGSQQVGMGRGLARVDEEAGELYRRADAILGYDLSSICFEGPTKELNRTEVSQPALYVTSAACLGAIRSGRVLPELSDVSPSFYAGLSLGEYTALYAAGAIGFEACLKLVQRRGQAMQAAAEQHEGAMVSVMGLEAEKVAALCEAVLREGIQEAGEMGAVLKPVNYNCPGQVVISGTVKACRRAVELSEEFGAIKAIELRVSGAFHTELMAPAVERLRGALEEVEFSQPETAVIANVDGEVYNGCGSIPQKLLDQLVYPVLWQQSVEAMLEAGVERFVEIGAGRVLTGLIKKICRARKSKGIVVVNTEGLS